MEKEITDYLVKKFNPVTIILHGSRASSFAKPHSDWDIYVFVDQEITGREFIGEIFMDQNLDAGLIKYPVDDEIIKQKLVAISHAAKVIYDTGSCGQKLIARAKEIREKGVNLTKKEIENKKLFMTRSVDRLRDAVNDDAFFFFRLGSDFIRSALNNWFTILHNEYSVPIYMSLPRIKKDDPEYYAALEKLWSKENNQIKLEAVEYIFTRLFTVQ